jgi:hypothetical protein
MCDNASLGASNDNRGRLVYQKLDRIRRVKKTVQLGRPGTFSWADQAKIEEVSSGLCSSADHDRNKSILNQFDGRLRRTDDFIGVVGLTKIFRSAQLCTQKAASKD